MKTIYIITLTVLLCGSAMAQKTDLLQDNILIGEVNNDNFKVLVDTNGLLLAMNEQFEENYDRVEIKTGRTIGDRKEKFYYIDVSSGTNGSNIVRWLTNKNGKLYMENSIQEETGYKDYYVACKGVEKCKPNLYTLGAEMNWICGETLGCKTEEEAKRNPCNKELSLVFSKY